MTKAGLCNRAILATGVAILAVSTPTIAAAQSADDGGEVEETRPQEPRSVIVVTAQKRTQALDEVPQSISVVGGDTLERQQADSFTDYVELVPSLSLTQSNPGETRVILRGVNTGSVGPSVPAPASATQRFWRAISTPSTLNGWRCFAARRGRCMDRMRWVG